MERRDIFLDEIERFSKAIANVLSRMLNKPEIPIADLVQDEQNNFLNDILNCDLEKFETYLKKLNANGLNDLKSILEVASSNSEGEHIDKKILAITTYLRDQFNSFQFQP